VVGVLFGAAILVTAGAIWLGADVTVSTLLPAAILPTLLATMDDEKRIEVTDAGLVVQQSIHEWDSFEEYVLTDEELRFEAPGLTGTYRFDVADVDDEQAVVGELNALLPGTSRPYSS
jgi:hypothetical protein